MKINIAGSDSRGSEQFCRKYNVSKLYSILNEKKNIENWDDSLLLVVDSGAYSWNKSQMVGLNQKKGLEPAEDFAKKYIEFVKSNCHKKMVFIEFDAYFDLPKKQVDEMYEIAHSFKNSRSKFCRVYHPHLDGGDLSVLRQWIDEGQDYIFIAQDSIDILDEIFSITKDEVKVHGLAMTKIKLLERYPFFSVDSVSPLSTVMFGKYSKPILDFEGKENIYNTKSIQCFDDDYERLEKAIIETKKTEEYITELWKKKGVVWDDLQF